MELKERKLRILKSIIEYYIQTGQPIGSRTLTEQNGIGLSSATIRNEMAGLEELGFLEQPHVSAGRIPSGRAFRLYVDKLMDVMPLSVNDAETLRVRISNHMEESAEVMKHVVNALSGATNCVAMALLPNVAGDRFEDIKLVKVTSDKALVIIVTNREILKDSFVNIPDGMEQYELDTISSLLRRELSGANMNDVVTRADELLKKEINIRKGVSKDILDEIIRRLESGDPGKLVLGGTANLFSFPDHNDIARIRSVINMLEEGESIYRLMRTALENELKVLIGSENEIEEVRDYSVITKNLPIGGQHSVGFGLIGPIRMDYAKMVAMLDFMGRRIIEVLGGKDNT